MNLRIQVTALSNGNNNNNNNININQVGILENRIRKKNSKKPIESRNNWHEKNSQFEPISAMEKVSLNRTFLLS